MTFLKNRRDPIKTGTVLFTSTSCNFTKNQVINQSLFRNTTEPILTIYRMRVIEWTSIERENKYPQVIHILSNHKPESKLNTP